MNSAEQQQRGWKDAFGIYAHPRVAAMLLLGFSAGLPFALTAVTLSLADPLRCEHDQRRYVCLGGHSLCS